jgi:hypothetical protein
MPKTYHLSSISIDELFFSDAMAFMGRENAKIPLGKWYFIGIMRPGCPRWVPMPV